MSDGTSGKCPVDLETRSLWSLWGGTKPSTPTSDNDNEKNSTASIPASLEEAAKHAQTPHPGQRLPLSTHRLESTIPRSSSSSSSNASHSTPAHQIVDPSSTTTQSINGNGNGNSATSTTWVYPSEQQVFNAMKRKGWNHVEEEAIPSFLQIHNSVNEQSWKQVREWESFAHVELSRFEGRPKDLTPKAWLLSTLGICDKPFDRHDWYVVVQDNHKDNHKTNDEKRYVLDFYMTGDTGGPGGLPRVDIDVRPALDSPQAFVQRGTRLLKEAFPGIARELDGRMRWQR